MSNYFKNTELARRYNISEATVRNWIKSVKEGRLNLELVEHGGRTYVANSIGNIAIVDRLIKQNRKYRNTNAVKTVAPTAEFYKTFNESQIYGIIRNLELYHDIPRQYGYFAEAASEWDEYINGQMAVDAASVVGRTIELLQINFGYIDQRLAKFDRVNIIDVGVGNGVPVRGLVEHLREQGKLGRYVGIDFSADMLNIVERQFRDWFGSAVKLDTYQMDMAGGNFPQFLVEDYMQSDQKVANLILLLGATPTNLRFPRDAFRTMNANMNRHDLLLYSDRVELELEPPEWFKYSYDVAPKELQLLGRHRFVLNCLGIEGRFYKAKTGFDTVNRRKYVHAELSVALNIKFMLGGREKVIHLEKGDKITVWHCWRWTAGELQKILEDCGFYTTQVSQTEDHYILTISEVKRD